jgi:hypothetical protein
MREGYRPTGVCIRYRWQWILDGASCTRAVETLKKAGLIDCQYYSQSASCNLTDAGEAAVNS